MHLLKLNKIAVSLAVGAAVVTSWYPANLNATTAATPYPAPEISAPKTEPVPTKTGSGEAGPSKYASLDAWLEKLAYYESNHRADIKVLDVNGKYSYGCLQFQEGTFRSYAIKHGLISRDTPTESVIYDCDLQKKLAKLMLAENPYNWQAWYTTVKKKGLGLPPKI